MNKKISAMFLSLVSVLFFSCADLSKNFVIDIDGIKNSIKLTYEFTETGSTFKWTKPSNLDDFAKYYLISEDSRDESSGSVNSCMKVDFSYRYDSQEHRIHKSFSSVDFTWRYNSDPLYLWVVTDSKRYNLGQFTTTTTDIERLKKEIVLNVDNSDLNDLKFQWAISSSISINPLRFYISQDSAEAYKETNHHFTALIVSEQYRESYYDDKVSIKYNIYNTENNYKIFNVDGSTNSPSSYYLWIQAEDGYHYNLGQFSEQYKVDIETIKKNIKPTYKFTSTGSTFSWTLSSNLQNRVTYFLISEDTNTTTTDTVSNCKYVDTQYQAESGNKLRIKNTISSVDFTWRYNSNPLYLWAYISGTFYNLGEFTTTTTDITSLRLSIMLFSDPEVKNSFNSEGYIAWAFTNTIPVNAMRFVISKDSSNGHSSGNINNCKSIKTKYKDDYYNDSVSIKADCYTDKENVRIYLIQAESQLTEGYYLWIQTEDESWYNLGSFAANTDFSNADSTETETEIEPTTPTTPTPTSPTPTSPSIETIRKNINLKSFLAAEGTWFSWTKPDGLEDMALCYMISENSSLEPADSLYCKQIKDIYLDASLNNKTSIKASANFIIFDTHVFSTTDLYLWVRDKTTGKAYNLGKFEAEKTEISKLKAQIQIYGDPYGTGSYDPYGRVFWTIPNDIETNIARFIITDDSSAYYESASNSFNCTPVSSDKVHPLFNDSVSINPESFVVQTDIPDLNLYRVNVSPKLSSIKYIWVQIEDGRWYNLGGIPVKTADFSI